MDSPAAFDSIFREESGRILASLVRLLGDFDLAEDALQDAFAIAIVRWKEDAIPPNPGAWLTTTARRAAIDRIRRARTFERKLQELAQETPLEAAPEADAMPIEDDRLRLIFTCCHPEIPIEGRIALTLRTLCGLSTEEIARAFLVPEATIAQRIVRAKKRIRDAKIPYTIPEADDLEERLDGVLAVIYLVFNEGYSASGGVTLVREELCGEAIRLGRLLLDLVPEEPEVGGLVGLMLLHDARRATRVDANGDMVTLEHQDRSRWNREQAAEGRAIVEAALGMGRPGPYQVQAAIAAVHHDAATPAETDWRQIVLLYDRLRAMTPGPVVELNRAAAVGMAFGPPAGLAALDQPALAAELDGFHLYHSARADLHRRAGDFAQAATAYRRALGLVENEAERRYLERRLAALG